MFPSPIALFSPLFFSRNSGEQTKQVHSQQNHTIQAKPYTLLGSNDTISIKRSDNLSFRGASPTERVRKYTTLCLQCGVTQAEIDDLHRQATNLPVVQQTSGTAKPSKMRSEFAKLLKQRYETQIANADGQYDGAYELE